MQENLGKLVNYIKVSESHAAPTSKTTPLALQVKASIQVYPKEKITLVGTAYFPSVREIAWVKRKKIPSDTNWLCVWCSITV